MKLIIWFVIVCLLPLQTAHCQKIGTWALSAKDLPVYQYTGRLPFVAADKNGKDANLPEDPFFLLGNYRMALLTHVSGIYQFVTAERAWARINAAEQTNYGWNDAGIGFKNNRATEKVTLIGINSMAADPASVQKTVGVGFARYTYPLANRVTCNRILSVKPSPKINTGNPSFVITVTLQNGGNTTQKLAYTERMLVNFVLNGTQYTAKAKRPLNSAVVLAVFPKLIAALQQSGNAQATAFITALTGYQARIKQNYMRDLGDRKFSARAYLSRTLRFGVDNVCLEPQGYLL